jgi:hypothetical protein
MITMKSILASIFFVLLTLCNIVFTSLGNNLWSASQKNSTTLRYSHLIEYNYCFPNQKIENTIQSHIERLCKFPHKSGFSFLFENKHSHDNLDNNNACNYIAFTEIILLSLDSPDIVFPFHNFW